MAQVTKQGEWMAQLQHRLNQVTPRWLWNRAPRAGITSGIPLLRARGMERLQSGVAPEARAQLRDEELLALVARGDREALGTLYDRHSRLVFNLALRITDARLDAEAVTQDVFLIVWQHARTFRDATGSISGWIVGITCRSALDMISSRQVPRPRAPNTSPDATPGVAPRTHGNLDWQAGFGDDVRAALAGLPADQRQTLELATYGGLTTTAIAAVLSTPEPLVKTQLRLGLTALRDALLPGLKVEQPIAGGDRGRTTVDRD